MFDTFSKYMYYVATLGNNYPAGSYYPVVIIQYYVISDDHTVNVFEVWFQWENYLIEHTATQHIHACVCTKYQSCFALKKSMHVCTRCVF